MNNMDLCRTVLEKLYDLDETNPFVVYEKIRLGEENFDMLQRVVTNDLPFETYLELALTYYQIGFPGESISVLKASPEHVMKYLWLAYLDPDNQKEWLNKGLEQSPELVFPFRDETFIVLDHLMKISDHWKLKYYASLIYWNKGLTDQAKFLMQECGEKPEYTPFYLSKAKLFHDDPEIKQEAILNADSIDRAYWRVKLALIDHLISKERFEEAAQLAEEILREKPEMAVSGIRYATALLRSGEYRKCIKFLESFEVLPYEGANEGRNIYHEVCIRAAYDELKMKKYKNAIHFAEKAKLWPVNLGSGRPYEVDERLENYITAYCFEKMGKNSEAQEKYNQVANELIEDGKENASFSLRISSLKNMNKQNEAYELILDFLKKDPDNIYLKWTKAREIDGDSTSLTKEIMKSQSENMLINNNFLLVHDLFAIIE